MKNQNSDPDPVQVLWEKVLKAKQLNGYSFKRNVKIENIKTNFYCEELKLIIIPNGESLTDQERNRKAKLESLGYTAIYLTSDGIMNKLDTVRYLIESEIEKLRENMNTLFRFRIEGGGLL